MATEQPNENKDTAKDKKSAYEIAKEKKEYAEIIASTTKSVIDTVSDSIKHYVEKKYSHDSTGLVVFGLVVIFILAAICFLACQNKIGESTIGAILGSLIGYALGRFNTNNQNREGK